MLPLAAYADRLSVRPGGTVRFHVSNATGAPVQPKLVRVICADPNPAGPGILLEPLKRTVTRLAEAGPHDVPQGSYARIDTLGNWLDGESFTVACRCFPTLPGGREQALISRLDVDGGGGFALMLDGHGRLRATLASGAGFVSCAAPRPLHARRWYVVWLRHDAAAGTVQVGQAELDAALLADATPSSASLTLEGTARLACEAPLLFAAAGVLAHSHFNGKLEAPALWARALGDDELARLAAGETVEGAVAHWDLGAEASGSRILDRGAHGCHGVLVNTPVRAVTGSRWRGAEMCFRHAPEQYAAIHFHDDDIDDCRWPAAFEWQVPQDTPSALYALVLRAGGAEDNVPFHVVAPRGRRGADVAVLASTFTYTVYGNFARWDWFENPAWKALWESQSADWKAYPHHPGAHQEYGLSTYNFHSDRSGISIASWHRPMLNVRIGYFSYPEPDLRASGLRHLPADTHLYSWLEGRGIDYDIITDQELHEEGVEALRDYPVLLTGTHPEYHTPATLDALCAYRDGGGRLAYLGGNGFYWKVALSPERDGVIEIRRGEGGIRAWAAEPGEYYNQFDGEYGGLWRRNGRPPQHLTGVGFTAQGAFIGSHYRRRPAASDARVAWMFEGLNADTFGAHGLSGHGAAGFELDRADKRLGTPRHALVVASSEDHAPEAPWVLVPEEMLTHVTTWPDEPARDLIRADMTFFETPAGGAVFSTGSITFCGSLLTAGGENDVSRLLENVLRRFLDPTPFVMPPEA